MKIKTQKQISDYHKMGWLSDNEAKKFMEEVIYEEKKQIKGVNAKLDRMKNDEVDMSEVVY